jgi:hypothetical protein
MCETQGGLGHLVVALVFIMEWEELEKQCHTNDHLTGSTQERCGVSGTASIDVGFGEEDLVAVQSIGVEKGLCQAVKEMSGQVIAAFPVFQFYPRPIVVSFCIPVFGLLRNRGSGPQNALRDEGLVVLSFLVVMDGLLLQPLLFPLLGVIPSFFGGRALRFLGRGCYGGELFHFWCRWFTKGLTSNKDCQSEISEPVLSGALRGNSEPSEETQRKHQIVSPSTGGRSS